MFHPIAAVSMFPDALYFTCHVYGIVWSGLDNVLLLSVICQVLHQAAVWWLPDHGYYMVSILGHFKLSWPQNYYLYYNTSHEGLISAFSIILYGTVLKPLIRQDIKKILVVFCFVVLLSMPYYVCYLTCIWLSWQAKTQKNTYPE